ncbi:MAG: cupin domain-containing protein [Patescibacteria group bacterium]
MTNVEIRLLLPAHADDRGEIIDLLNTQEPLGHIGMITFTENAVRANHYHKKSMQYDYVVSGRLELITKGVDEPMTATKRHILEPGDLAIIPINVIHAYRALQPTVIIDMTTRSREGGGYENDTFRVEPIL